MRLMTELVQALGKMDHYTDDNPWWGTSVLYYTSPMTTKSWGLAWQQTRSLDCYEVYECLWCILKFSPEKSQWWSNAKSFTNRTTKVTTKRFNKMYKHNWVYNIALLPSSEVFIRPMVLWAIGHDELVIRQVSTRSTGDHAPEIYFLFKKPTISNINSRNIRNLRTKLLVLNCF